jgi:Na+-driven multidrug efflux pump
MPNDESTTTASRAETATGLGHEFRLQRRIAVPLIASYMAEIGMWFTDAVIVGHLGGTELGAVGFSGLVFWEVVLTVAFIPSVVGVFVGNAYGRGDSAAVRRNVQQGLWFACALSLPTMLLSWHLMTLLSFTGQEAVVLSLGTAYLHTLLWCVPPMLLFTVLRCFVTGLSRPGVVTVIAVLALPVNAALNYALVFGAVGLPPMGVAGAGLGTSIVNWLMLLALAASIVRNPAFRAYNIFRDLGALDFSEWRQICRIGLPVAGIRAIGGSVFMAWYFRRRSTGRKLRRHYGNRLQHCYYRRSRGYDRCSRRSRDGRRSSAGRKAGRQPHHRRRLCQRGLLCGCPVVGLWDDCRRFSRHRQPGKRAGGRLD